MKRLFKVCLLSIFAVILSFTKMDLVNAANENILIISGTGKNVGDEIAIGSEHFYVIENDGNKIHALAKYNLDTFIRPVFNTSSLQSENAPTESIGNGSFFAPDAEVTYPHNIFNNVVFMSLEVYKDHFLKNFNLSNSITFITKEQLDALGCNKNDLVCNDDKTACVLGNSVCARTYPWLFTTSYWTATASSYNTLYVVEKNGNIQIGLSTNSTQYGFRPVISFALAELPDVNAQKDDITDEKDDTQMSQEAKATKACYVCNSLNDKYVWTDQETVLRSYAEYDCKIDASISESECVLSPQTGVEQHLLEFVGLISVGMLILTVVKKKEVFKKI